MPGFVQSGCVAKVSRLSRFLACWRRAVELRGRAEANCNILGCRRPDDVSLPYDKTLVLSAESILKFPGSMYQPLEVLANLRSSVHSRVYVSGGKPRLAKPP